MPAVLFVDDEPNVLRAYERTLRNQGFEILTALSAQIGLQILSSKSVDVIVSDERMPGQVSGTDFLQSVRRLYPSVIRIMVTGEMALAIADKAIRDGLLYRYLAKPVKSEEIARTVLNALNLKRIQALSQANRTMTTGREHAK